MDFGLQWLRPEKKHPNWLLTHVFFDTCKEGRISLFLWLVLLNCSVLSPALYKHCLFSSLALFLNGNAISRRARTTCYFRAAVFTCHSSRRFSSFFKPNHFGAPVPTSHTASTPLHRTFVEAKPIPLKEIGFLSHFTIRNTNLTRSVRDARALMLRTVLLGYCDTLE